MQSLASILAILSLSGITLSNPTVRYDTAQKPIIHEVEPNDNFTLTPIRDALVSNKVIGDVLDDFEPKYYLDVLYPKHKTRVTLGNEIKVKDVKDRPRLGIHPVVPHLNNAKSLDTITFTIILTDPDAISRYNPTWSEMCHWILTNITAKANRDDSLNGGIELDLEEDYAFPFVPDEESWFSPNHKHNSSPCKRDGKGKKCLPGELESYLPPGPPPKTGWHRYVFVLLTGDATRLQAPKHRKHWGYGKPRHGIRDFADQYGLEVVSANFFFAENKRQ